MQTAVDDLSTRYLKVSRAARELGVDSSWIYRAVQRGDLEAADLGALVVSKASVERMKAKRHRTTVAA